MACIEIVISPAGQAQVRTTGFIGSNCRAASQFLEQALGITTQEQLTPEFHQITDLQQTSESEHP